MAKWILIRKGADYQAIGKQFGIDPLLARILINRGIETSEEIDGYLNGTEEGFHNPLLMKDMDKAVAILQKKIEQGKKIRIIGDYDADGVCSTAILQMGLQQAGALVDAVIPHRMKDGYGLNLSLVEQAHADGVDTILTCDNGISAYAQTEEAKRMGMTVVITDHHEVPFEEKDGMRHYLVPKADAIVDPKQEDCPYPFKGICGAFVACKLMQALLGKEMKQEYMELAAFATITDIMELKDENRILVKEGLKMISDTRLVGLRALLQVLGLQGASITVFHLGFMLGPCINAAGRIGSADRALELLTGQDEIQAMELAGDLKAMNDSRKLLTEKGCDAAIEMIESSDLKDRRVLVIYLKDCHESVAGIIAGRLKEKYNRPTLVITDSEEGLKGSARSIEAYNIYEEMTKVKDIFIKYGGHPQAAGFSLPKDKLEELDRRLNEQCNLTQEDLQGRLMIDADAPFSYCTPEFMNQLERMEPKGTGNEGPVFARKNLVLLSGKLLGNTGKVGKYRIQDTDGYRCELTLFQRNEEFRKMLVATYGEESVTAAFAGKKKITFSAAYYPQWNEYQGRRTLQYIMTDFC